VTAKNTTITPNTVSSSRRVSDGRDKGYQEPALRGIENR
jgi:hypothetical protein